MLTQMNNVDMQTIKLKVQCPLSGSNKVVLIDKIKISDLVKAYKKVFDVDISSEFNDLKELNFYYCPESGLKFYYPAITGSELFYEQMQKFDWYYLENKSEYELALKFIKKKDVVLEVGCGSGIFLQKIDNTGCTGLEFNNKAILSAKERGFHVLKKSVQEYSAEAANKYDIVCAFQVLEHVKDIHSFISSCMKCLKPEGLLIYSVPSADSFLSINDNEFLNMPPHHVSLWTDKALQTIASLFNLEIITIEHEQLADIHTLSYAAGMIRRGIKKRLGFKHRLIDMSYLGRVIGAISYLAGKFYMRRLKDSDIRPIGHSVTIVYKKTGQDI